MFHAASMTGVLGIPASGGVSVFVPYFEPAAVLDAIEQYRVNITLMVPIMVAMLLAHPEFRPERLATLDRWSTARRRCRRACSTQISRAVPAARPLPGLRHDRGVRRAHAAHRRRPPTRRRRAALGRPTGLRRRRSRIRDEDDRDVPVGHSGEVCARAGNFMREYWNRPEETAAAFRDGWYHSGDTGYLDEQGFLFSSTAEGHDRHGRRERLLDRGRERDLDPSGVAQVAVIGIPHDLWGEAVHAIVVPKPGVESHRGRDHRAGRSRRSPATRCRSRSSSAPIRSRSRAR